MTPMTRSPAPRRAAAAPRSTSQFPRFVPLGLLTALTAILLAGPLLSGGSRIVSAEGTDIFVHFFASRDFGFGEMRHGNFPLWNPHVFSGAPYFGALQSALLYPPNFLFLLLPTSAAINWSVALHLALLGWFFCVWARGHGCSETAAAVAGCCLVFGGTVFPHIYAGHLSNVCTMAWAPLIFAALDRLVDGPFRVRWWCLGALGVAMQMLSGHIQYAFYTALAAGLYALGRVIAQRPPWDVLVWLLLLYPAGAVLAAPQLVAAAAMAQEILRQDALPYEFASMFGFPPENLITAVVPEFFGNRLPPEYWGRCYLWEMSLFLGVSGLLFAGVAIARGRDRAVWVLVACFAALALVAFGRNTPLYRPLYDWFPGISRFRGISKFTFQAALFFCLLIARGFDCLRVQPKVQRPAAWAMLAVGLLLLAGWAWAGQADWRAIVMAVLAKGESYLNPQAAASPEFLRSVAASASRSFAFSAGAAFALSGALFFGRRLRWQPQILAGIAALELVRFAVAWNASFDPQDARRPALREFISDRDGEYRVLQLATPHNTQLLGGYDIWGYDPAVPARYGQLMTFLQGGNPRAATQYVEFRNLDPLMSLFRLRYAFVPAPGDMRVAEAPTPPLPQTLLLTDYRVASDRWKVLDMLREPGFDPKRTVILETVPRPVPAVGGEAGTVRITARSTDSMDVEAALPAPAIMLITDCYSPHWRAAAIGGGSQRTYEVLPGDFALRAIPLTAGHHRFRIEYRVPFLGPAWAVSAAAWAGLVVALATARRPTGTGRSNPLGIRFFAHRQPGGR